MFCVHCGGPLQRRWLAPSPTPPPDEIAPACAACGYIHYEGPVPVAAAIVRDGPRVLLAQPHNASHPALVAGYLKPGETVEQAAAREVLEETGYSVAIRRILGSYPGLNAQVVLVVCIADVTGGGLRIQPEELLDAAWFDHNALPGWPADWPLARIFADYRDCEAAVAPDATSRASSDVSPSR